MKVTDLLRPGFMVPFACFTLAAVLLYFESLWFIMPGALGIGWLISRLVDRRKTGVSWLD